MSFLGLDIPQEKRAQNDNISMGLNTTTIDHSALEKCYFEHYNKLVGLARTLVDDVESAEEVVQQVFANAAKQNSSLRQDDVMNYIRIGVLNQSRSHLRKRRTQRKHLALVANEYDREPGDSNELMASTLALKAGLSQLSRRQRECISLAYLEGLTHTEIAITLAISKGSVKQHITRGVFALQKSLKDIL